MAESRFVYVTYIRTTPEKLWQALTESEFTRKYWGETWQVSDWKVGSPWKLMMPDGGVADAGEIVEIEPGRKLVLTWSNEFRSDLKEDSPARLTYELQPVGDSVKLTVIHESDTPLSRLIQAVALGWPAILSSLKTMLETGESLEITRSWQQGNAG